METIDIFADISADIFADISADIFAKSGVFISAREVWRCVYAPMIDINKSAKSAAFSIKILQKAILNTRRTLVFRDGSKNRPFKFRDIARRKYN